MTEKFSAWEILGLALTCRPRRPYQLTVWSQFFRPHMSKNLLYGCALCLKFCDLSSIFFSIVQHFSALLNIVKHCSTIFCLILYYSLQFSIFQYYSWFSIKHWPLFENIANLEAFKTWFIIAQHCSVNSQSRQRMNEQHVQSCSWKKCMNAIKILLL